MAYTKFHKNWPLTTRVTRWSTLKTLNRVFSISQKWYLPGYSTKPFNCCRISGFIYGPMALTAKRSRLSIVQRLQPIIKAWYKRTKVSVVCHSTTIQYLSKRLNASSNSFTSDSRNRASQKVTP